MSARRRRKDQMDLFDQAYLAVQPWSTAPGFVVVRDHFVITKRPRSCFQ
jgi:hypothetical protein